VSEKSDKRSHHLRSTFGKRLRTLRKAAGLTQAEIAGRLGVTVEHISNMERGKAAPSFELLHHLADELEVDPGALLAREPAAEQPSHFGPAEMDALKTVAGLHTKDLFWAFDQDLRMVYISPSVREALGFEPEEFMAMSLLERFPDHLHADLQALADLVREGRLDEVPDRFELDHLRKDGPPLPMDVRTSLLRDGEGGFAGMIGVSRDISEHKRLEQELLASQARYELLAENVKDIVWTTDASLNCIFITPSVTSHLGYTLEELTTQPWETFYTEESLEMMVANGRHLLEGRIEEFRTRIEVEMIAKDGRIVPFEMITTVLTDEAGNFAGLTGVSRDISMRKRFEEERRENERHLAQAQELARLGSWRRSLVDDRISWSDNLFRVFGFEPGQVEPSEATMRTLIGEEGMAALSVARQRAAVTGRIRHEFRIVTAAGERRYMSMIGQVVYDDEGNPLELVGTTQDVTAQRTAELALRKSLDELREANARLGDEISERRAAQARLEDNLRFMSTLLSAIPLPVFWHDEELRLTGYNTAAERFFRGHAKGFLGKTVAETHHDPEMGRRFLETDKALLRTGGMETAETTLVDGQGRKREVILNRAGFTRADGSPGGLIGCFQDITEHAWVQHALRQSRERFRRLFKGWPLPTTIWQRQGDDIVLADYNDAALEATAGRIADRVGMPLADHGRLDPAAETDVTAVMLGGPSIRKEAEHTIPGGLRPLHSLVNVIGAGDDTVMLVAEDIERRLQAETELETTSALLNSLLDALPLPVGWKDAQDRCLGANEAMTRLIGVRAAQSLGSPATKFFPEPVGRAIREHDAQLLAGRPVNPLSISMADAAGQQRELRRRPAVFLDADGGRNVVAVFEDLTDLARLERRLDLEQRLLAGLFAAARDAVFLIDAADGRIVEANPAAEVLYGYSREELLSMRNTDLSAEPNRTRTALNEKRDAVPVRFHRAKDGRVFPVEITSGYTEHAGRTLAATFIRDISRLRDCEVVLASSRQVAVHLPDQMHEQAPMGVMIVQGGRIILASTGWLELFGCPAESQALGRTACEFVAQAHREELAAILSGPLASSTELEVNGSASRGGNRLRLHISMLHDEPEPTHLCFVQRC
jgi:PAS domain S-box-containing protein